MSQSKTYPLPDPAAIALKVKAAGGPAIDPTQPTGEASADGVTASWSVSGGQVTITILSKPWIVSWGTLWAHVDAIFA
jgi:hypothetical protein